MEAGSVPLKHPLNMGKRMHSAEKLAGGKKNVNRHIDLLLAANYL